MRLLLIEDEQHAIDQLIEGLRVRTPDIQLTIARSRDAGQEAIDHGEYDFIVCDLRLPAEDGSLDPREEHGLAVRTYARSVTPGTPCLFFTGFETSPAILRQLSAGGTRDLFQNSKEYPLTQLLTKDRLVECVNDIATFQVTSKHSRP